MESYMIVAFHMFNGHIVHEIEMHQVTLYNIFKCKGNISCLGSITKRYGPRSHTVISYSKFQQLVYDGGAKRWAHDKQLERAVFI